MRLVSMTAFVLEQNEKIKKDKYGIESYYSTMQVSINYANFLKQTLKLEMFMPCDEVGNILEEPIFHEPNNENEIGNYQILSDEYCEARAKVLFENIPIAQAKWLVNTFSTIESLSDISNTITPIYLTESALKQIGL